jgi:hypothetical protein
MIRRSGGFPAPATGMQSSPRLLAVPVTPRLASDLRRREDSNLDRQASGASGSMSCIEGTAAKCTTASTGRLQPERTLHFRYLQLLDDPASFRCVGVILEQVNHHAIGSPDQEILVAGGAPCEALQRGLPPRARAPFPYQVASKHPKGT